MPKWWCTNCQGEREHAAVYCHGACGNNCNHRCQSCGQETLANIFEPNTGDNRKDAVRQAVAQAQRKAQQTGAAGEIRVEMINGNASSGNYQCQVLVYNTHTKNYRVDYPL